MSAGGPGRREVAHRVFAAEYDDATLEYAESDEERAPNFVVLPSGARVNRIFVVGVLTAIEQVNEDTVRARIADPTGAFVVYAGQYQPDELAALQSMESPAFVAVTGKANTFSPEGSDRVLTSVRPESVTEVDAETRDRWVVATAEHTLARVQTAGDALGRAERGEDLRIALVRDGVEPGLAEGIAKAIDHYDTGADYLGAVSDLATQALEVVAGERSEVEALDAEPAGGDGSTTPGDLAALLDDDRLAVTRAAGDVDVEALVDDGADATADAEGEEADETETDASDDVSPAETSATDEEADESSESDDVGGDDDAATADEDSEAATDDSEGHEASETAASGTGASDGDANAGADPEPSADGQVEAEDADDTSETTSTAEAATDAPPETDDTAPPDTDDKTSDETYDVPEEEREEIEQEYGVGFQSGTEVDPAGEAGIETDDAPPTEDDSAGAADATVDAAAESEGDADDRDAGDEDDGEDESDEAEDDVDLEGPVLAEMEAFDDGDGADREALIDAVAEATGADAEAIDDAIDDLLMSGQCYEPGDGQLKPI